MFDIAINEKLGECAALEYFRKEEIDVETPHNPLYEDTCDEIPPQLPDHEDLEDNHHEKYIGPDILLPLGKLFKTD